MIEIETATAPADSPPRDQVEQERADKSARVKTSSEGFGRSFPGKRSPSWAVGERG
jgi:hypothetical protein